MRTYYTMTVEGAKQVCRAGFEDNRPTGEPVITGYSDGNFPPGQFPSGGATAG